MEGIHGTMIEIDFYAWWLQVTKLMIGSRYIQKLKIKSKKKFINRYKYRLKQD